MARVVHRHGKGDDAILAEGSDGVDGAVETFLTYLHQYTASYYNTVGVGIGYLAINLEVGEVADHCYFAASTYLTAYFGDDVSEGSFAWRTDICIVESATVFGKALFEDAVLQLLHLEVGLLYTHFVLILLFHLLEQHRL